MPKRNVKEVEEIFKKAKFLDHLGLQLKGCGKGWCESELSVKSFHLQQDGLVHAGVVATLADHTAGAAAVSLLPNDKIILTVEFKLNLLRAARGSALRCRADVLKEGRRLIIAESEVFSAEEGGEKMAAKAIVTLAVVEKSV